MTFFAIELLQPVVCPKFMLAQEAGAWPCTAVSMQSLKSSRTACSARPSRATRTPQACLQCWTKPTGGAAPCRRAQPLITMPTGSIPARQPEPNTLASQQPLLQLLMPDTVRIQVLSAEYVFATAAGPQPPLPGSSNPGSSSSPGSISNSGVSDTVTNSNQSSTNEAPYSSAQGQGQAPYSSSEKDTKEDNSLPVRMALGMLAFYRSAMSPIMQPSCRYLPTCSEYSIQSYKRFGVWRGSVLTAWRLLRCSPFGSSGYDPPQWPPPGLGLLYGDKSWEYAPQVTVVLGAAFLAWLGNELWAEITHIL